MSRRVGQVELMLNAEIQDVEHWIRHVWGAHNLGSKERLRDIARDVNRSGQFNWEWTSRMLARKLRQRGWIIEQGSGGIVWVWGIERRIAGSDQEWSV